MVENRIASRQGAASPRVVIGLEFLQNYADELNRKGFSKSMGIHWFINQRPDPAEEGKFIRFLDSKSALEG